VGPLGPPVCAAAREIFHIQHVGRRRETRFSSNFQTVELRDARLLYRLLETGGMPRNSD